MCFSCSKFGNFPEGFLFLWCLDRVFCYLTTSTAATTFTTATATTDVLPVETSCGYLLSKLKFPFCLIFEDLIRNVIHVFF